MNILARNSFSRHYNTYEKFAFIQKQVVKQFSSYKKFFKGLGIDLGCGTGFLTEEIKDKQNKIVGVDISKNMIDVYISKGFDAVVADIEHLPFQNVFDFAVSSFALHWTDINKSFSQINKTLKRNGYFIFSIPVENSLEELHKIIGKTFEFPSSEKVLKNLKKNDFKILIYESKIYPLIFQNGKDVATYFKLTGTAVNRKDKTFGEKLRNIKILTKINSKIKTHFNIMFVVAVKD